MYFSVYQVAVLLKGHAHVNVASRRRHDESQGESPLMAGEHPTIPALPLLLPLLPPAIT